MRVLASLTILLSLVIGIVPQFTDCESTGRHLTLADGREIPMKCHWTARGELAVAAPAAVVGVGMLLTKRKETRRALGVTSGVLGIATILLPTALIGVCGSPEMICNSTMRPLLILMGSLVIAISVVAVALSFIKGDTAA